MKRAVLPLLCSAGLCLVALQARAALNQIQIANLTASGGVLNVPYTASDFPIATDLTFTGLQLTLDYTDGTMVTTSLYDASHIAQTSLGSILSGNFVLTTDPFDATAHGGLTGEFFGYTNTTDTVDVYTAPLPATTTASVSGVSGVYGSNPGLTTTGASSDIVIFNNTATYNIGTISLVAADGPNTTVPEPGAIGLLVAGAMSLLGLRRRVRRG
jgi:hypothetical protein